MRLEPEINSIGCALRTFLETTGSGYESEGQEFESLRAPAPVPAKAAFAGASGLKAAIQPHRDML